METVYYSPNFPLVTTMVLNKPMKMTEHLLRKELERMIQEEQERTAINQAMDYLVMIEHPIDREELLELMMQSDEVQILLRNVEGTMMEKSDQEMIEEYNEKTLLSFLENLTNWLETR